MSVATETIEATVDEAIGDESVIRDLSLDDRGEDVKVVQEILGKRGYRSLDVDGIFGRETEAFVIHFQWLHGLSVNGVVGPRTRAALGLYARPPSGDGEEAVLREIEGLELGLGEPLTEHAHVEVGDPEEDEPA